MLNLLESELNERELLGNYEVMMNFKGFFGFGTEKKAAASSTVDDEEEDVNVEKADGNEDEDDEDDDDDDNENNDGDDGGDGDLMMPVIEWIGGMIPRLANTL